MPCYDVVEYRIVRAEYHIRADTADDAGEIRGEVIEEELTDSYSDELLVQEVPCRS